MPLTFLKNPIFKILFGFIPTLIFITGFSFVIITYSGNDPNNLHYDSAKSLCNLDYLFNNNSVKTITKVTTKNEAVDIFGKSNLSSKVIKRLSAKTEVTVIRKENDWNKVRVGHYAGWIKEKELITKNNTVKIDNFKGFDGQLKKIEVNNSASVSKVIELAKGYLGTKYVWGGISPEGFDCSGFINYIFMKSGIKLNRVACDQAKNGIPVTDGKLKIGDLLFFDTNNTKDKINHVGLYIGEKHFIHASSSKEQVVISDLSSYYKDVFVTARRILN